MTTDSKIIKYICSVRERYPRVGKEEIKVMLDKYWELRGKKKISAYVIGKIIKGNNQFFEVSGKGIL